MFSLFISVCTGGITRSLQDDFTYNEATAHCVKLHCELSK